MARRKTVRTDGDSIRAESGKPSSTDTPPGSRAEYVYGVLRNEILEGTLLPGFSILQDRVAERLGVSITPVREALRKLESDGLVSYQTNYGATVTEMSSQALLELYQLRATLEGLTARLAATTISKDELASLETINETMKGALLKGDVDQLANGSRRFHTMIGDIGGPAFLGGHLRWVRQKFPNRAAESAWRNPIRAAEILECHLLISKALANGDGATAERLMSEHIYGVGLRLASAERADYINH